MQIKSFYGEFIENGLNGLAVVDEVGDLGNFSFNDFNNMEYRLVRNDTVYSNSGIWSIQQDRFREIGFFETTKLSIIVPEVLIFDVDYENSSSPHRKIRLFIEPDELGFGVAVELFLEKVKKLLF
ncbi:hypothetical protein WIW50_15690 [Flavobacteriaceae bacterium 3-367]